LISSIELFAASALEPSMVGARLNEPGDADSVAERMEFKPPVFPVGRIASESGPPNSATERNATRCPPSARNSPSPVPIRLCPPSQDPAKTREFLGWSRVAGAKSLRPQTRWRSGESSANPSLGAESLLSRENTGNSFGFRAFAARRGPENGRFRATFGGISPEPGTGNDYPASRESLPPHAGHPDQPARHWGASPRSRGGRPPSGLVVPPKRAALRGTALAT
jgi:hypothetical protein